MNDDSSDCLARDSTFVELIGFKSARGTELRDEAHTPSSASRKHMSSTKIVWYLLDFTDIGVRVV